MYWNPQDDCDLLEVLDRVINFMVMEDYVSSMKKDDEGDSLALRTDDRELTKTHQTGWRIEGWTPRQLYPSNQAGGVQAVLHIEE